MTSASAPSRPTPLLSALSIGDLAVLIRYDHNTRETNWSLLLYAAEDLLVEASYLSPKNVEEECDCRTWSTPKEIVDWANDPGARGPILTCRLPFFGDRRAALTFKNMVKKSEGSGDQYSGKTGRASITRALGALVNEEPWSSKAADQVLLSQKLDRLEQEFLEGQTSVLIDVKIEDRGP